MSIHYPPIQKGALDNAGAGPLKFFAIPPGPGKAPGALLRLVQQPQPGGGGRKGSGPCCTTIETDAAGRLDGDPDTPDSKYIKAARTTFAPLIKKVYEVDPLICPHCGNQMRHLAVIEDSAVITWILCHLGALDLFPPLRVLPDGQEWPKHSQIPLTNHLVGDIA